MWLAATSEPALSATTGLSVPHLRSRHVLACSVCSLRPCSSRRQAAGQSIDFVHFPANDSLGLRDVHFLTRDSFESSNCSTACDSILLVLAGYSQPMLRLSSGSSEQNLCYYCSIFLNYIVSAGPHLMADSG